MKHKILLLFILLNSAGVLGLHSQTIKADKNNFVASKAYISIETLMGKQAVRVVKDSTVNIADAPSYARVKGIEMKNGTIEVKVLSRLLKNAAPGSRGFIGVAFRINENDTRFESIYIRPTNGRADDQVRRNHSTQYFCYPDYPFNRLRQESPEKYESYADMELNRWITLKIEVKDSAAKLYIDGNKQPCLIVNDLKLGANNKGTIGLWVDGGTEGYFSDLKIVKKD